ncbi:MAG: methionine synthase [Mycobacteriales bacterium]|nr:methionine synthase [Mycobacteriales bacterium]
MTPPWGPGAATGIGSLPGTDPLEAARVVLGELAVPHLPELPARGPHADLAGRGLALLVDLHADLQPSGWRFVPRPGRDARLARDLLARDLDALEEAADGAHPAVLKTQATGPWTLSTLVELHRGDRALADHGAMADLAESLAEGLRRHLADLRARFPQTALVLQLDEPSLPAVLAARIPTASGFATLRAPDRQTARDRLRTVIGVHDGTVAVHCCAPSPPVELLLEAGATALSLDAAVLTPRDDDLLGEAVDRGVPVLLGLVPGTDADLSDLDARLAPVKRLWHRLGLDPALLPQSVVVTPACGLAGASPSYSRSALAACTEMGRRLTEAPE